MKKALFVLAAAALMGVGCANQNRGDSASMGVVNARCAITNSGPVNPAIEPAVYKGQKVGFCCAGCKSKWEALSDGEKAEHLAAACAAN